MLTQGATSTLGLVHSVVPLFYRITSYGMEHANHTIASEITIEFRCATLQTEWRSVSVQL